MGGDATATTDDGHPLGVKYVDITMSGVAPHTTPTPTPTSTTGPSSLRVTDLGRDHITLQWDSDPSATYELLRAGIPIQ